MAVIEKVRQPKVSARTAARAKAIKPAPVDTRVLPLDQIAPKVVRLFLGAKP